MRRSKSWKANGKTLLAVATDELAKARLRAQGRQIGAGVDGREIAITSGKRSFQFFKRFLPLPLGCVNQAALEDHMRRLAEVAPFVQLLQCLLVFSLSQISLGQAHVRRVEIRIQPQSVLKCSDGFAISAL